jgi:gamma-glutamylcyclotransferase (GGCT)/AIG2-like uncharacterized protein YtfP
MLADVVRALTGERFASAPAHLHDHARYALHGERFPGLVAEPGARTDGVLLEGVGARALAILDRFEGSLYERCDVVVHTTGGARAACVYRLARDGRHRLGRERWNPEVFTRRDASLYVDACRRFLRECANASS